MKSGSASEDATSLEMRRVSAGNRWTGGFEAAAIYFLTGVSCFSSLDTMPCSRPNCSVLGHILHRKFSERFG